MQMVIALVFKDQLLTSFRQGRKPLMYYFPSEEQYIGNGPLRAWITLTLPAILYNFSILPPFKIKLINVHCRHQSEEEWLTKILRKNARPHFCASLYLRCAAVHVTRVIYIFPPRLHFNVHFWFRSDGICFLEAMMNELWTLF